MLAQVLSDIDRLELLATGASSTDVAPAAAPLTLAEAQALLARSRTDLSTLKTEDFALLRQVLLQTMQEVAS